MNPEALYGKLILLWGLWFTASIMAILLSPFSLAFASAIVAGADLFLASSLIVTILFFKFTEKP